LEPEEVHEGDDDNVFPKGSKTT